MEIEICEGEITQVNASWWSSMYLINVVRKAKTNIKGNIGKRKAIYKVYGCFRENLNALSHLTR